MYQYCSTTSANPNDNKQQTMQTPKQNSPRKCKSANARYSTFRWQIDPFYGVQPYDTNQAINTENGYHISRNKEIFIKRRCSSSHERAHTILQCCEDCKDTALKRRWKAPFSCRNLSYPFMTFKTTNEAETTVVKRRGFSSSYYPHTASH